MLAPHLHQSVPLARLAAAPGEQGVSERTRWLAAYQSGGLEALSPPARSDKGLRRFPRELVEFVEGAAVRKPVPTIHRQAASIAASRDWPVPSYWTVYKIVAALDPALVTLAVEGSKKYRETRELVYRRAAKASNEIWQADRCPRYRSSSLALIVPTSLVKTVLSSLRNPPSGCFESRTPTAQVRRASWTQLCGLDESLRLDFRHVVMQEPPASL